MRAMDGMISTHLERDEIEYNDHGNWNEMMPLNRPQTHDVMAKLSNCDVLK